MPRCTGMEDSEAAACELNYIPCEDKLLRFPVKEKQIGSSESFLHSGLSHLTFPNHYSECVTAIKTETKIFIRLHCKTPSASRRRNLNTEVSL